MRAWCVVTPVDRGEEVRKRLRDQGVLFKQLRIPREGDRLFLPTTRKVDVGLPTLEREFETAYAAVRSYKDLVRVPDRLRPLLPSAFDVIGDIAIMRIPDELVPYRERIGEAVLGWNKKIRAVAQDHGVAGALRIRELEPIAGERRTTTVHVEHGLRYAVDVARAYFSPRLATERWRVAKQVRPGEIVADPFAGVGPYAILIARKTPVRRVHASDVNPVAVRFLQENAGTNRAEKVDVHEGDARAVLRGIAPVDRIILDLPHSAMDFLSDATRALAPRGILHVYGILERTDREDRERAIRSAVKKEGRSVETMAVHPVRAYSPTQAHLAFDVSVGPG